MEACAPLRSQFSRTFSKSSTNHNAAFTFNPKPLQTNIKPSHLLPLPSALRFRPHAASPSTATTAPGDAHDGVQLQSEDDKFDWYSHWYPLAPVCDLDKRVPHAKTVLGIEVVLWWDRAEEKWQVFEDKCPHRLAPLSQGRIDNLGRLQCVYHGWCFDGNGNCKLIPQAPRDGPEVIFLIFKSKHLFIPVLQRD